MGLASIRIHDELNLYHISHKRDQGIVLCVTPAVTPHPLPQSLIVCVDAEIHEIFLLLDVDLPIY